MGKVKRLEKEGTVREEVSATGSVIESGNNSSMSVIEGTLKGLCNSCWSRDPET